MSTTTIMNKRAQFFILKGGSHKVGLMNLYASNSESERENLWLSLSDYADLADCWLVGGDFNMIEDATDRLGGVGTTISGREAKCALIFTHTRIPSFLSIRWECGCYKFVSTISYVPTSHFLNLLVPILVTNACLLTNM